MESDVQFIVSRVAEKILVLFYGTHDVDRVILVQLAPSSRCCVLE